MVATSSLYFEKSLLLFCLNYYYLGENTNLISYTFHTHCAENLAHWIYLRTQPTEVKHIHVFILFIQSFHNHCPMVVVIIQDVNDHLEDALISSGVPQSIAKC